MATFRINKTRDYTVMSNYHLKDKGLSLKAKGLLSIMLSLPDDWDYSFDGLLAIVQEGKASLQSALDELKACRYLEIVKILPCKENGGKLTYEYNIYETRQDPENKCLETSALKQVPCDKCLETDHNKNTDTNNINKECKCITNIKETTKESDNSAQEIVDFFNEHRGEMPKVTKLTSQRKSAINARLRENTLDEVKQVIKYAEVSAFLQGRKAQWQATFDWLMKPTNFVKVLEGNYNKEQCEKPREKSETDKKLDEIFGG